MSAPMTREEIIRGLMARGVAKGVAILAAGTAAPPPETAGYVQVVGAPLLFPICLTLPWSALISENRRFASRGSRIFMTAPYKAARATAKKIGLAAMTASDGKLFPPLARPLALVARVWFPDNRIHDAPNFAGATHNALKKIVFADDAWLHDVRWIRAGVDVDAPRAEIDIRPL